jgi:hypothetical protein
MRAALLGVGLLLVGCRTADRESPSVGRVTGSILAGPSCPVERPGDPACEPTPVAGVVELTHDGRVVASARLDSSGGFIIEIPAGGYVLTVDTGGNILPSCAPVEVLVVADQAVTADVMCDTGIR